MTCWVVLPAGVRESYCFAGRVDTILITPSIVASRYPLVVVDCSSIPVFRIIYRKLMAFLYVMNLLANLGYLGKQFVSL